MISYSHDGKLNIIGDEELDFNINSDDNPPPAYEFGADLFDELFNTSYTVPTSPCQQ
jgi:hypothetical protein